VGRDIQAQEERWLIVRYTIKKGDTLSGLAKRYGSTVESLASLNSIKDPDKIYAGDVITIPDHEPAAITWVRDKITGWFRA
jgi:LysM repeat protein